jgi:hypothetical protein
MHACVCLLLLLLQAGRAAREHAFHLALKDMMGYLHTGAAQRSSKHSNSNSKGDSTAAVQSAQDMMDYLHMGGRQKTKK